MVESYGIGKIGVSGMHPEATDEWYQKYGLTDPGMVPTPTSATN